MRCPTDPNEALVAKGMLVEPIGSLGAAAPAARLSGCLCSGFGIVEVGVVSSGVSGEGGGTEGRDAICRTISFAASICSGVGPRAIGGGGAPPLNAPPASCD
jgi:hypothetical protein